MSSTRWRNTVTSPSGSTARWTPARTCPGCARSAADERAGAGHRVAAGPVLGPLLRRPALRPRTAVPAPGDGRLLPLEVERWCARADTVDLQVLERCEGAVLDVGCGPGRLVAELAARGRPVLGVDISPAAVARTPRLVGRTLTRSVFEPLPGEGRWDTVLLFDGNLGIGGAPSALLRRTARLLRVGGFLIAETVPMNVDERAEVRLVSGVGTDPEGEAAFPLGPPRHTRAAAARPRTAGAPPISGRRADAPSSPCAPAAPAAAPNRRTAGP